MQTALRRIGSDLGVEWDAQTYKLTGYISPEEDWFFEEEVQCEEGM